MLVGRRLVVLVVALGVVGGGCATADTESETRLRAGVVGEPVTDNPWEMASTGDVPARYVLPDPAQLYRLIPPTYTIGPLLAADATPPSPAETGGEEWEVTVDLDPSVQWSDGIPVTADDVVFTFDTVRRLGLGGLYESMWPPADGEGGAGVTAVEKVDRSTVRIVFDARPDPAVWPFGVGTAAVFPEHYWRPLVADLTAADDLYDLSGVGSPTVSGFVLTAHEGSRWAVDVSTRTRTKGTSNVVYASGAVETTRPDGTTVALGGEPGGAVVAEYEEGPFVDGIDYAVYGTVEAAVDAIEDGEIDLLLSPDGVPRALYRQLLADPELTVTVNSRLGFRYVAFDLTQAPTNDATLRRAIACRIDSPLLAVEVLGGSVEPVGSLVPAGLASWHDPGLEPPCAGLDEAERFDRAVGMLTDAGWSWETRPAWDAASRDAIPAGTGLTDPAGNPIPGLVLLAPAWHVDSARAVYAAHIAEWARQLGIPVAVTTVGADEVIRRVAAGPEQGGWDLAVSGWDLPPLPDHVFRLFSGELNFTGYASETLDGLAARFSSAPTVDDAVEAVRAAEALLADDLPYILLYTETIIEVRRSNIALPFERVPDGFQHFDGVPTLVRMTP